MRGGAGSSPLRPTGRGRCDDRGSGTGLTAALVLFIVGATVVGVWIAGWLASLQRAARAADLAALAGASAHVRAADECEAARRVARANEAEVVECEVEGDARDFVVRVEVRSELRPHVSAAPRWALGRATAGSLPR